MNHASRVLCCLVLATGFLAAQSTTSPAHPTPSAPSSEKIPVMDGAAGPCSIELTVIGADNKPAYAATVKVHIDYGFGGFHKLDLEAGTNSDGKVKFPTEIKRVRGERWSA